MNGELISSYSRAQAIDDGVLIDLTDATDAQGKRLSPFKYPVAITAAAFEATISAGGKWDAEADGGQSLILPGCQDFAGRCWDVLWMLRCAIGRAGDRRQATFSVSVLVDGVARRRTVHLKAVCGPGDEAEPVIAIMLPDED